MRLFLLFRQFLAQNAITFHRNPCRGRRIHSLEPRGMSGAPTCLEIRIPPLIMLLSNFPAAALTALQRPSRDRPDDSVALECPATPPRPRRHRRRRGSVHQKELPMNPWRPPSSLRVFDRQNPLLPAEFSMPPSSLSLRSVFVDNDHASHHKSRGRNLLELPAVPETARNLFRGMISRVETEPTRRKGRSP